MEKIQYGDVNRFLVSIGLVLLSLSFAVPYFYLSEDFEMYIEADRIKLYDERVQALFYERQRMVSTMLVSLPWICMLMLIFGLSSLVTGLYMWFKRQAKTDEKENLDIEKLKLEIRHLTPEERREKAQAEVEVNEIAEIIELRKSAKGGVDLAKDQAVINYLNVEERVVDHFKKYKTDNFEILDNIKLADRFWVDILLEAKNTVYSDRIIEVKYASKALSYSVVADALTRLDKYTSFYLGFYNRKVVPVLIIVFSKEIGLTNEKLRYTKEKIHSDTESYRSLKRLHVEFISEEEIDNFDVRRILKR